MPGADTPRPENEIFVSYSKEDRARVQVLVEALEKEGWKVFWDQEILPGEDWASSAETEGNVLKRPEMLTGRELTGAAKELAAQRLGSDGVSSCECARQPGEGRRSAQPPGERRLPVGPRDRASSEGR